MSGADTELEPRLRETLRVKAAQVPERAEAFDPALAPLGDGGGRGRAKASFPFLIAAAVAVVIAVAVGVVIALSGEDRHEPGGVAAPTGPAVARLEVHALPTLKFQADEFTTSAGINEIEFVDFGGTHALVFEDPALSYFGVTVPTGPTRGKVDLEAGRDYRIFCTIPGHRVAGMEAVIHVSAAPGSTPPG